MNRGEKLLTLINSEGWAEAKAIITEKIMDIQSIMNIEGKTGDEIIADLKLRKALIGEMMDWIKEIEGSARQFEGNEVRSVKVEEDHIDRE